MVGLPAIGGALVAGFSSEMSCATERLKFATPVEGPMVASLFIRSAN